MGQAIGNLGSTVGQGLQTFGSNVVNKNVVDPSQANWGDLDTGEKFARIAAGGLQGLGQGLNQQYNGNQMKRRNEGSNPYFYGYGQ